MIEEVVISHHLASIEAFGAKALTSNHHKLLHVVELIRRGGPVHEFSVCSYDDHSGHSQTQCAMYERLQARLNKHGISNKSNVPEQLLISDWHKKVVALRGIEYPDRSRFTPPYFLPHSIQQTPTRNEPKVQTADRPSTQQAVLHSDAEKSIRDRASGEATCQRTGVHRCQRRAIQVPKRRWCL